MCIDVKLLLVPQLLLLHTIAFAQATFPGVEPWRVRQNTPDASQVYSIWDHSLPWVIAFFSIVILAIVVYMLWPSCEIEREEPPIHARLTTTGVYYKVSGRLLSPTEAVPFSEHREAGLLIVSPEEEFSSELVITALGPRECQILFRGEVQANQVMVFSLSDLPDFPVRHMSVAVKIVKGFSQISNGEHFCLLRARYVGISEQDGMQILWRYLQFLKQESVVT